MEQDITVNRHRGADTSIEAFDSTPKETRRKTRMMIHKHIMDQGSYGATLEEICDRLGIPIQSGSARVSELRRDNMILDSGKRRLTKSGRSARVHVCYAGQLGLFPEKKTYI